MIIREGKPGGVYNIGGHNERKNIEVVKTILKTMDRPETLIEYVRDRPGHDRRYAIDPTKIQRELGWRASTDFEEGIARTVAWYLENRDWWEEIINGGYKKYYEQMPDNSWIGINSSL